MCKTIPAFCLLAIAIAIIAQCTASSLAGFFYFGNIKKGLKIGNNLKKMEKIAFLLDF
jgi:hypothetical protein